VEVNQGQVDVDPQLESRDPETTIETLVNAEIYRPNTEDSAVDGLMTLFTSDQGETTSFFDYTSYANLDRTTLLNGIGPSATASRALQVSTLQPSSITATMDSTMISNGRNNVLNPDLYLFDDVSVSLGRMLIFRRRCNCGPQIACRQ
jgi:hypothetical protein